MIIPRRAIGEKRHRGWEMSNKHVWCAAGDNAGETRRTRLCFLISGPVEMELFKDVSIKKEKLNEVRFSRVWSLLST